MSSPRILVVDDDARLCAMLSEFFGDKGFCVHTAPDGKSMLSALERDRFDLVILDVMLPGEDGLNLCRLLRQTTTLPIIMISGMGSEMDRVVGLEMGADDYVVKPFSARELLARVKAILRRVAQSAGTPLAHTQSRRILEFGGWQVDTTRRRVTSVEGVGVEMTGAEFNLLLAFATNPRRPLSRRELLDLTAARGSVACDRTIDVQVVKLRRKLEKDPKVPELIKTVRGSGYVLAAGVTAKAVSGHQ